MRAKRPRSESLEPVDIPDLLLTERNSRLPISRIRRPCLLYLDSAYALDHRQPLKPAPCRNPGCEDVIAHQSDSMTVTPSRSTASIAIAASVTSLVRAS